MIRQTGGTAVGEISTRSRPLARASATACGGGMMPSWAPVSSMTRISRTLMRSLIRTRSSRRGPRSKAITTSKFDRRGSLHPASRARLRSPLRPAPLARYRRLRRSLRDFFPCRRDESRDRAAALIPAGPASHRDGALCRFPIADDEHVGDLVQLGLTNFITNLLLTPVELDSQSGVSELAFHRFGILQVAIRNR